MDLTVLETSSCIQMNSDKETLIKQEAIPQKEMKSECLSFKDWKKQKEALCKTEQTTVQPPPCPKLSKSRNVPNNSHSWQQQMPQMIGNIFCHNNYNTAWMPNNSDGYGYFNNSSSLPPPPPLFGGPNKHPWTPQQFFIGGHSNAFMNQLANHSMRGGKNCHLYRPQNIPPNNPMLRRTGAKSVPIEDASKMKDNKKTAHNTKSSNPLQKANKATIAKKSKQKINTSGAVVAQNSTNPYSSVVLKIGPPKGLGSGGSWVAKPLWPPHNAEVPDTKEEKQRIWKEYRQAMKPFKNREFANAKRTMQRLSKKPKEERDEKEVTRMQQAEEIIAKYKAILTEKHGPNWTLKIPGNNAPTAISNGQSAGEESISSTPAQIYVRKATSPPPWFKNNRGNVPQKTFAFPNRTS